MKLDQARRYALSLPETVEQPHFDYASFRVGGKIFATAPPDGGYLHVFVGEEQRERALALAPGSTEKLFWGKRVVGLRIALKDAKPAFVQGLLSQAWREKAPKWLQARV
ncbi:MmcQ/YjbR family DNA-binding protein [Luteimonas gilva]|uniref:MmcQ/YjbR family DNA-binding protein n=1 Tax=Luteimonas gilva TaxID=2572684 RepID=A0A4U5JYF4_9GAMM|nr:MmcQ/YjbR family DNA-binding protein [Luteimonas gilva]TKR33848.1 MmcQ/YjbR family DNA-binding protein [Luteimonas gilva]